VVAGSILCGVFAFGVITPVWAQTGFGPVQAASSGQLLEEVRALQMPVRVLYLAAHPDDENTRMLTWLSKGMRVEAAYLSLTRGDGGQNLIGTEAGDELGLIRTYELMGARALDGARQFFTRANDFGYSKTPGETFRQWHRDSLLADVVYVLRRFRPHVVITRFTPEPSATHGHHTASAQLAVEAFEAAADPARFPEQLSASIRVWKTRTLYWNTSWWFFGRPDFDKTGLERVDVGGYSSITGRSHGETAALSRSMHRSQGFGSALQRGEEPEYLKWLAGDSLAGGIEAILRDEAARARRASAHKAYWQSLAAAERAFQVDKPWLMLPKLMEARGYLQQWNGKPGWDEEMARMDRLLLRVAGIWHELAANQPTVHPGDSLNLQFRTICRHPVVVRLESLDWHTRAGVEGGRAGQEPGRYLLNASTRVDSILPFNKFLVRDKRMRLPGDIPLAQPFWLQGRTGRTGFFDLPGQPWVGVPTDPAAVQVVAGYVIDVGQQKLRISIPVDVFHRNTDPAEGERYRPLAVVPPVAVAFVEPVALHTGNGPISVGVRLTAGPQSGGLSVQLLSPPGWTTDPPVHSVAALAAGESRILRFVLDARGAPEGGVLKVRALGEGVTFTRSIQTLEHTHLPQLTLLPEAAIPVVYAPMNRFRKSIAYIPGAGDEIPAALRAMGYEVTERAAGEWTAEGLKPYEAVVLGVRLVNTSEAYRKLYPLLKNFVHAGGTVLMQYQTSRGLLNDSLAPFRLQIGNQRTTVEDAPVRWLLPAHELLNHPNRLSDADFAGWVQERGLYYAARWDSLKADAPLSMADPGEDGQSGALVAGREGRGWWIYTGLSLFRQLPAGVPGAYRLLSNCVELGSRRSPSIRQEETTRTPDP